MTVASPDTILILCAFAAFQSLRRIRHVPAFCPHKGVDRYKSDSTVPAPSEDSLKQNGKWLREPDAVEETVRRVRFIVRSVGESHA